MSEPMPGSKWAKGLLITACLGCLVALGLPGHAGQAASSTIAPKDKPFIVVVPVSANDKYRMTRKLGHWSPFQLLKAGLPSPPVPAKIAIRKRTEFYAFFLDPTGALAGKTVVFSWFHGDQARAYTQPVAVPVFRHPDVAYPVATYAIWSAPGGKLPFAGLRSVLSKAQWNRSRCYGPRLVKVSTLKGFQANPRGGRIPIAGKTLAEASFEIHQPGVQIY